MTDASSREQFYRPEPTPSIKSTSTLRHRLSSFSLLAPRRKRSQASKGHSGGIGYSASYRVAGYIRSRSPSPEPSLEIRRPSGLGRRVSITGHSSERRSEEEQQKPACSHVRRKSISAPDLLALPEGLMRWAELSETEETVDDEHTREPVCMFTKIPPELLKTLFPFVLPLDLPSLARVCKSFLPPTRVLLYRDINFLPNANEQRLHACIDILAARRDLAELVQCFACSSIPRAAKVPGRSPFPAVTFAIALSNLTNLTSLTLPRFEPPSFFYTTFQLRSLTLLWETATADELQNMFSWLASQPSLTSLSTPHLILDARISHILSGAGSQPDHSSDRSEDRPLLSLASPSQLLPRLNHILGPSSLVAALTPGRPLTSLTLHIHSTLYDGLRPSALMAAIAQATTPVTHLSVVTTSRSKIDARTLDRVLMAAGAELGKDLRTLEIESTLEDDVSYFMPASPTATETLFRRFCTSSYTESYLVIRLSTLFVSAALRLHRTSLLLPRLPPPPRCPSRRQYHPQRHLRRDPVQTRCSLRVTRSAHSSGSGANSVVRCEPWRSRRADAGASRKGLAVRFTPVLEEHQQSERKPAAKRKLHLLTY